jgi:regulator of sigma E protease
VKGSIADKAGLKKGDRFIAIDSQEVTSARHLRTLLQDRKAKEVHISVQRNSQNLKLIAQLDTSGKLGIFPADSVVTVTKHYSIFGAIVPGTKLAFKIVGDNISGFQKIATGNADASQNLSGPVKIAQVYKDRVEKQGWKGFWVLTAMLSMVLAFMNILPIPALDGGHLVFLLIEAVTGKEPSVKVRMIAQQIGMFLLLGLMAYIFFNDFRGIFFGK